MADMLADAAEWLAGQMPDYLGQTVTYRRGGASVSLAATKAPVRRQTDPTFGLLIPDECDWIIKASLLVLNSATVEPREITDTIEEANGKRWQVMPSEGEAAYRQSDPFGNAWRIHTKLVDD